MKTYIGVDVASTKLDIANNGSTKQVLNQPAAIKPWLRSLAPTAHLICEATGAYHQPLLRACWQLGVTVSLVNPERVRALAKANGRHAKTDCIDARLLADFGARQQPAPTAAPDPIRAQLQELNTRRLQLVAQRTQELNRQQQPALGKFAGASLRRLCKCLDREITRLEAYADQLIASSPALSAQVAELTKVAGVGTQTARALLATMPELGTICRRRVASLAGLAPFPCESGQWKGRRHIRGGRATVRQALYMAAFSAMHHNGHLKSFAQRLIANGKPHNVVITAVMRKLLIHLNARLAKQRLLQEEL